MNGSIQSKLLLSASLVLSAFLGLAGVILDAAYQEGTRKALHEQLQIHLYSILAFAELNADNTLEITDTLPEPRFSLPSSNLYAYVVDDLGNTVWRTSSSRGHSLQATEKLIAGDKLFVPHNEQNNSYISLHYKAILENDLGVTKPFEIIISESVESSNQQISSFRSVLWQWLGGIGVLLIVVQLFMLRKNLEPLRNIVADLEDMHAGNRQQLANHYSDELRDIADTLNRLINNERSHLQRYRNTLSDLAHSLKTPLSVLTGLYEQPNLDASDLQTLEKQTLMMRQLVDYQLQRAASKGHQTLTQAIHLEPLANQLLDSLQKVYIDKNIQLIKHLDGKLHFYAEKGDLFELLGNLLDNAFKWADKQVSISLQDLQNTPDQKSGIILIIEDDGPGVADEVLSKVLKRGVRADETILGHGIGLAVVNELVASYKGTLTSQVSELGGQKWLVKIPGKT